MKSIYLLYRYNYIILNMDIRLFLDPLTMEKIMNAVKSGKYDDEYAFIFAAIHDKLNQGDSKQSEILLETASDRLSEAEEPEIENHSGMSVHSLSDRTFKTLESLMEHGDNNLQVFSQDKIYGPESAGLIWIFHNRFFPIKIVLNIVSQIMVRENKTWFNLDDFSDEIAKTIEKFVLEIYQNTSLDSSVHQGFPLPQEALVERYEKMHKERPKSFRSNIRGFRGSVDDKIRQLVSTRQMSSRLRFFSQFVGKSTMKDHGLVYSGACFEMGLLAARGEKKDLEITLSQKGLEFTKLKNPAISFADGEKQNDKETFSKEECDFIQKEIVARYELEEIIVERILKMRKEILDGNQPEISKNVRRIFETEKGDYLSLKFPDKIDQIHSNPDTDVIQWQVIAIMSEHQKKEGVLKGRRRSEMWAKLSLDIERNGTSKEKALEYLVDKQIQFQINATMSRIKELDDIKSKPMTN
jgi:hypothetical protein